MKEKLKIIPVDLFEQYNLHLNENLSTLFFHLTEAEISTENFELAQIIKKALDPNSLLNPGKLGLGE